MNEDGMILAYDEETGTWGVKEEPYCVVELPTEEDYKRFEEMVKFWKDHHDEEGNEI